jgi:hypothetical protein
MAENNAGAFGAGAAAGAVVAYALRPKAAAAAGGEDSSALITAINDLTTAVNILIANLGGGGSGNPIAIFNYPPNPGKIMTQTIIPPMVGQAERLPDFIIPADKELVIKAQLTNFGVIYVGRTKTEAENPNVGYPLIFNESISYKIRNAQEIWVANTVAGEGVNLTVEQEG